MERPLAFLTALLIGSLATGIVFFILKKPVSRDQDTSGNDDQELDIDLSSIRIS
jgi:PTS system fructose-specific IIC component